MYFFSNYEKQNSLLTKENIEIKIPGGLSTSKKDWYPFVLFFNDDVGFSRYMKKNLSLTILYNFGAFDTIEGSSNYYNPQSDYYSSFYGSYIVKNNGDDKPFAFTLNNEPILNEIIAVPKYDLNYLVLQSLGCEESKIKIEYSIDNIKNNELYAGYGGWTIIDAVIKTNSPIHKFIEKKRAYIQYGKPMKKYVVKNDFCEIELKGRIVAKYFKKWGVTIFLYVMAPDNKTVNECDENILSKTVIKKQL
ncbi:hypothetical protein [Abyssisolibacter fermentans]|uniref:hypothetical protein n=1 Tax=Abyssisolibacter fermentans TaxID=1766203 RepID=UPI00082CE2F4|nr:hypothetical protein [Abyssisolibacter fermentans]